MKSKLFALAAGVVTAAFMFTACSKDQPLSPKLDDPTPSSLDQAYGGFNTNDEVSAFGDAALLNEANEDVDVNDPLSALGKSAETNGIKSYAVRLAWGKLQGDSTATAVKNWNGSVEINKGALAVLKTVRFENDDRLSLPRTSRKKIEFTSHTQTSYDGLVIVIIDNDSSHANLPGELSFTLSDFSRTIKFSKLDSMSHVEPAGEGYEVSIISRAKEVIPFEGGFLAGHWNKEKEHGGSFKGRWINSLGTHAGFIKGIWGVNRNDEKVFFGKYIGANGEFRGLLHGKWEYLRDEDHGAFRGEWTNRARQVQGTLAGHFRSGRPGDGKGFFHGRWKEGR